MEVDWIDNFLDFKRLLDLISKMTFDSSIVGFQVGSNEVGTRGQNIDPNVIRILQQRSIVLSQHVFERLKGNLKLAIIQGVQNKESIDDISRRVQNEFEGLKTYEADRIARTETINAFNQAREEAWKTNPFARWKMWLAHFDRRTAEDSKRLSGQIQKIGEPFIDWATGQQVMSPPLRPNDRCTMIPLHTLPKTTVEWKGQTYDSEHLHTEAKEK